MADTSLYNLLVAVLCAVIIVLAMNLVGSLLISALIVFPALSAMRLCRSFRGVTLLSALLAVFSAALGILLSILIAVGLWKAEAVLGTATKGLSVLALDIWRRVNQKGNARNRESVLVKPLKINVITCKIPLFFSRTLSN